MLITLLYVKINLQPNRGCFFRIIVFIVNCFVLVDKLLLSKCTQQRLTNTIPLIVIPDEC